MVFDVFYVDACLVNGNLPSKSQAWQWDGEQWVIPVDVASSVQTDAGQAAQPADTPAS